MSYKITALTLSLIAFFVAGCSTAPLQKGFGASTANNEQVQVINSKAGNESGPDVALDGQKSERLLKSYRTDTGKAATTSLIELK